MHSYKFCIGLYTVLQQLKLDKPKGKSTRNAPYVSQKHNRATAKNTIEILYTWANGPHRSHLGNDSFISASSTSVYLKQSATAVKKYWNVNLRQPDKSELFNLGTSLPANTNRNLFRTEPPGSSSEKHNSLYANNSCIISKGLQT